MSFSFVPRYAFREVTDISTGFLDWLGVKFLMIDIDNTVASYEDKSLSNDIIQWASGIKRGGVELYIVSNNRRNGRVEAFAESLGIGFVKAARKPSTKGLQQAMSDLGFREKESAFVGDQVFTDVLAANRAGVVSIIVRPQSFKNPLLALRFALETPFRAACRKRCKIKTFKCN